MKQKKLANGWESYECERRVQKGCRGRVKINSQQIVTVAPHTHTPNPARCDALKLVAEVKDLAQTTQQPGQQILANTTAGIQDAVAAELPNLSAIRRNIRRERQIVNNPLSVPLTRNNIPNPLPPNYLITNDGRPFLAWDNGDARRILLFITAEKLTLLEQSLHWFIDGTFDTVALIYSQLFTIHALTMGTVIVCGFALLPNKTLG